METTLRDTIVREITIAAPRERVFAALSRAEELANWFPDAVEGTLAVGERPVFDFGEYGRHSVYVEAMAEPSYLAYRWIPGAIYVPQGFIGDVLKEPHTLCEFHLEEVPEGTRVRLVESGFASLPSEFYAKSVEENEGGWDVMIYRLKTYIETGTAVSPQQG
jgi:uncharacterized protein YndB with AHSA1/START domain